MPKIAWNLTFGLIALFGAVVLYLLLTANEADEDWNRFVAEHHCVSVGHQAGNNQGGWRCDDGQIHYRWRQQK